MTEEADVAGLGAGAVVVGVDQSSGARSALVAALREAAGRRVRLLVVTTYESPDRWGPEAAGLVDLELIEDELRRRAEEAVASVAADAAAQGIEVPATRVVVLPGGAVDLLCRAAEGAELLVVGHRGRGAFASRLLGSVGLGAVVHAPCSVLVVRERHDEAVQT